MWLQKLTLDRYERDPEARAFVDRRCFTFSSHDAMGWSHGMMFPKCVLGDYTSEGKQGFYCLVCGTIVDSQEPEMSFFCWLLGRVVLLPMKHNTVSGLV